MLLIELDVLKSGDTLPVRTCIRHDIKRVYDEVG